MSPYESSIIGDEEKMSRDESLMYSNKEKMWAQPHTWLDHVVEECIVRKQEEKIVTNASVWLTDI